MILTNFYRNENLLNTFVLEWHEFLGNVMRDVLPEVVLSSLLLNNVQLKIHQESFRGSIL